MSETFYSRLLNDPFDDPVLYVGFRYQRRALLFDLGRIDSLGLRDLHKITDVFVSHTHIDHFVGFDHLLRTSLNREGEIRLYGPRGITDNVRGKLAGYTWNLIESYPLRLTIYEIDEERQHITRFRADRQFTPEEGGSVNFEGMLVDDPDFGVRAAILDHRIPCLAFALEEKNRLNIRRDRMESLGIERGPWLDELKRMVREKAPESARLEMPVRSGEEKLQLSLKEWRETLLLEQQGQKIVYVVDNVFSPANAERVVALARGAALFYCEAAFAQSDEGRAKERYHLTAAQAGELARLARVQRFVPFHFSQRYEKEPGRLREEAMAAFEQAP
ncbi:MAG: ribonuclease Z [Deltaproteobacteria bacterium]|nr:ribonuclease Z [Deltaproteobacteria bacterium]